MSKKAIQKYLTLMLVGVVSAFLVVSLSGMVADHLRSLKHLESDEGYFEDIKNWYGAVTGTRYRNASKEIALSAAASDGGIVLEASFCYPDKFPYKLLERMAIKDFQIIDMTGKIVYSETNASEYSNINSGRVSLPLSLDALSSGDYTLEILSFSGARTTESPLEILGSWELDFHI